MSKFFNEVQKANQWTQQQHANRNLDVNQMLESLKLVPETQPVDARLIDRRKVKVANGNTARLVLNSNDSSRAALEAYRGLRTRLMRAQAKSTLKSIVISSSLPNEGKTLTTMNLGLCYAQLPERRVLVLDADLRTCGLTSMLDDPNIPGLAEVLAGDMPLDEAIVGTNHKNLYVLPAGVVSSSPPELFSGSRWHEFIAHCSQLFSIVLVDTPPILPLSDFELISAACDGIVVVVRAHFGQRETLQKAASTLDSKKLVGVVFNATVGSGKDYYGYGKS
jgi:capsular exopolysaccharide synthesis family protein